VVAVGGYGKIPFLLLGRLAVDQRFRGKGMAKKLGILGIIVDAKNDGFVSFYEDFGFKKIKSSRKRQVLPINTLSKLLR